jgi:hypothetical protein
MVFFGKIINSKLELNEPLAFKDFLSTIKEYPSVILKLEKRRNTRSNQANKYYWGYVLAEIAKETGHSPEELHDIFKKKFLPKRFLKIKGKEYEAEPTTTKCDTLEFMDFVENIKVFGATELGIVWLSLDDYNLI